VTILSHDFDVTIASHSDSHAVTRSVALQTLPIRKSAIWRWKHCNP